MAADPVAAGSAAEDPFAVLGLPPAVDDAAVRAAYRAVLRAHPPERDPEGFKRIRVAYEALRDAACRVRAAVLLHPWLDDVDVPSPEELSAPRPASPDTALLRSELERLVASGTDLAGRGFADDLRPPPAPPWARG